MDWNYIIKRVVTGVLIFLAIYFLKGYILTDVYAYVTPATTSCVTENISGGNDSCQTPPNIITVSATGGFGNNVWFQHTDMLQPGHTYYVYLYVELYGYEMDGPSTSLQFFTGNSGSAGYSATPDRNEQKFFHKVDDLHWKLGWSFHLDSSGSFDTMRFSWFSPCYIGSKAGIIYNRVGIDYAVLEVVDLTPSSGGGNAQDIIDNNYSDTQSIINNNNSNTQNIINNNNTNTQDIINNQIENTENSIKSEQVCTDINYDTTISNGTIETDGSISSATTSRVTDFLKIDKYSTITVLTVRTSGASRLCFYDSSKTKISCMTSLTVGQQLTIPDNASFVRFSVVRSQRAPTFSLCRSGNSVLNDTLNDDNTSNEQSELQDFFDNFGQYDDENISSLLTAPLRLFNRLTETCSPVTLTYKNQDIIVPCGNEVFWDKPIASPFRNWWNIFVGGFSIYFLATKLIKVITDCLNPDKENLEVLGL